MLFKILDNIRSKPKHVRDQYALGIAVFCTLAIGGVWSLSLPSRFASGTQVAALASSTNAAPFSNFFTQLKHQFSGVKEAIEQMPEATSTPLSAASSTEAALDLKLTTENKEAMAATSSDTITFGNGGTKNSSSTENTWNAPVLIATTSSNTTR